MIQARHNAMLLTTSLEFEECARILRAALKRSKLEVITERALDREVRRKVGLPLKRYEIFTVWDPLQLYQATLAGGEPGIFGSFNVVVSQQGTGSTIVVPSEAALTGNADTIAVKFMAHSISEELVRVLEQVAQEARRMPHSGRGFYLVRWLRAWGKRTDGVHAGGVK